MRAYSQTYPATVLIFSFATCPLLWLVHRLRSTPSPPLLYPSFLDLSSPELLKGEKGAVQFSAPPESYDTLSYAGRPPEPFDGTKIAGIEFLREKYSGPRPSGSGE
jgi:hypothetical protein